MEAKAAAAAAAGSSNPHSPALPRDPPATQPDGGVGAMALTHQELRIHERRSQEKARSDDSFSADGKTLSTRDPPAMRRLSSAPLGSVGDDLGSVPQFVPPQAARPNGKGSSTVCLQRGSKLSEESQASSSTSQVSASPASLAARLAARLAGRGHRRTSNDQKREVRGGSVLRLMA